MLLALSDYLYANNDDDDADKSKSYKAQCSSKINGAFRVGFYY